MLTSNHPLEVASHFHIFHFNNGAWSSDRSLRLRPLPQPQGHKAWALRVCVEVERYRFLKSCYSSHKQHVPMFPPQSGFSLPSAAHLAVTHSFVGTSQWQHWGCFSPGLAPQWPPCPPSMWCHEHKCPAKHLRCCSSHCVQYIEKHWHASLKFKNTHTHRARYNQTLFYCHPTPPIQHKYVTCVLQYTIFSFFCCCRLVTSTPRFRDSFETFFL